jgi:hypothetical protein
MHKGIRPPSLLFLEWPSCVVFLSVLPGFAGRNSTEEASKNEKKERKRSGVLPPWLDVAAEIVGQKRNKGLGRLVFRSLGRAVSRGKK